MTDKITCRELENHDDSGNGNVASKQITCDQGIPFYFAVKKGDAWYRWLVNKRFDEQNNVCALVL